MARTINRILVTGAAGRLGSAVRQGLRGQYELVRLSDMAEMEPAGEGEEVIVTNLNEAETVASLCEGIDAVVHLGGQPREADWPTIINSNLIGAINLWEGARIHGVDRVLFASSNHAVGLHRREVTLDHTTPARPDTRYGLSKAFGEDLAALYAFKWGVKAFCMRIGACAPEPINERALHIFQSYDDFVRLVRAGLAADYTYEIVYGVSANRDLWWDNSRATELGYTPEDTAEDWREKVAGVLPVDAVDAAFQGGIFASTEFTADPMKVP